MAYSVPLKRPMSWTFFGNCDQNGALCAEETRLSSPSGNPEPPNWLM
jgi:hypothetical protein